MKNLDVMIRELHGDKNWSPSPSVPVQLSNWYWQYFFRQYWYLYYLYCQYFLKVLLTTLFINSEVSVECAVKKISSRLS